MATEAETELDAASAAVSRAIDAKLNDLHAGIERVVAERDALRAALKRVKRELSVPAAEYVPAIRDCFDIIDAALSKATGEV